MIDIRRIETILASMTNLLRLGRLDDWAHALERCSHDFVVDPSATCARVVSMYGGMGSLNDLVLYRNGQPLIKENNELDALRAELYDLCRAMPP
ncbi:DUF6966 domain-containing protein [Paraburkholderia sp.]|uniref:DUF6966 domain-containing protein n=1 Tax=Paraburkholderia sp. TaxID=1926495 RepID=UPI003D6EDBD7